MRTILFPIFASLLLAALPAAAWTHEQDTRLNLVFEESQQTHPKKAVVAVPIVEPIIGVDGIRLSFEGVYTAAFTNSDDPRNGKGKVTLRIKIIRDDRVVWKKKKKDKVKDDWDTTRECGNCTHKLRACESFKGTLRPGDLVLFSFTFEAMPKFDRAENAPIDARILAMPESCGG